MLKDYWNIC